MKSNEEILNLLRQDKTCININSKKHLNKIKTILFNNNIDISYIGEKYICFKECSCVRLITAPKGERLLYSHKKFYQDECFSIINFSSLVSDKQKIRFVNF